MSDEIRQIVKIQIEDEEGIPTRDLSQGHRENGFAIVEDDLHSGTNHNSSLQILDIELLGLLHTKPMSGYEMRKMMKSSFSANISYGTLYPHLRFLESSRLIEGSWESRRWKTAQKKRVYRLTITGKQAMIRSVGDLSETAGKLRSMLAGLDWKSS